MYLGFFEVFMSYVDILKENGIISSRGVTLPIYFDKMYMCFDCNKTWISKEYCNVCRFCGSKELWNYEDHVRELKKVVFGDWY
jgi:hypothetical protein